jgi:hypothetical protein
MSGAKVNARIGAAISLLSKSLERSRSDRALTEVVDEAELREVEDSPISRLFGGFAGIVESAGEDGSGAGGGAGAGDSASSDPNLHELPNFPTHDQNVGDGGEHACGTTAEWSIFDYFNPGAPGNDRFSIDQAIRRGNAGASIDDLQSYAEDHGYRTAIKDDASLDDIKQMIDEGVPCLCNIDPDGGDNWNLHYVDVVGYKTDDSGNITSLEIMNPSGGQIEEMPVDKFMSEWSDLHIGGMHQGVNRQMLTMVPDDDRLIKGTDGIERRASDIDLPSDGFFGNIFNDSQPARVLDDGKSAFLNGWDRTKSGDVIGGSSQMVGSLFDFVFGGVGFALTDWVGYGLESAGGSAIDWANQQWNSGGFFGKVGAVFGWAGGGIMEGLGWGFSKIGDGLSWLGGQIGSAVTSVGNAVGDAVSSVGNAIGDAASSAWNAISSIF